MLNAESLIEFAENAEFEELQVDPMIFERLRESEGWQVIARVCASWIAQRRDDLETITVATEEGRNELVYLQGAIEVLRNVLILPEALKVDSKNEKERKDA